MRLAPLLATVAAVLVGTAVLAAPPAAATVPAQAEEPWRLTGDLAAHDPALVAGGSGEDWYVFATGEASMGGGTIQIRSSPDGKDWTYEGTIWDTIPAWLGEAVPGVHNLWAPEVFEYDGTYYMYYAASTFGHNTSVIGLATNTTLDPSDPDYEWVDEGEVVSSTSDDNYNAIDPGIVEDSDGTPWMAFGSYWSGIRMVELDWPSGKPADPGEESLHIADRKAAPNAIEAPYIVENDGWYYLFTSWGQCCAGVDSDYKIMVGRSQDVTGPYVDRDGRSLLDGGGTTLLEAAGNRVGPGGQSVSEEIIAYHYYDASADGAPRLALQPVVWGDDGWPVLRNSA
ncbi:arabinan endo-1,5-alpha-L-arabinosidase [Pseudonocardia sp. MH-G8]|uniref:arabinan endo-1,5-alpha-L-arabinosidase n=1 Tax=Pseudonocardia sp. MH-G8 TaxID=1854588 RepID=UPI0018E9FF8D|nr:arabinan endo-1,5-alpha-L-arabinosidase [Pseudonocardia sp. MH-G8]